MSSRLQDVILRDTRSNQPAASAVAPGTIYFVTDELVTERSNGTSWENYSDTGTVVIRGIQGVAGLIGPEPEEPEIPLIVSPPGNIFKGDAGAGGAAGLVPAPIIGDATKFLRGDATWQAASGASDVLVARVVLNDGQIKTLNSLPVTVIAAPGLGKYINVIRVFSIKETTAGAYSSAVSFRVRYNGSAADVITAASWFVANTNKRWFYPALPAVGDTVDVVNKAVEISSSADVTGGNAGNYIVIAITYSVVNDGP